MWVPIKKLADAQQGTVFPATVTELITWCADGSDSIYNWQYAQELIEGALRLKASDGSMVKLARDPANLPLRQYSAETCEELLAALTIVNTHLTRLGLDDPIDVTPLIENAE